MVNVEIIQSSAKHRWDPTDLQWFNNTKATMELAEFTYHMPAKVNVKFLFSDEISSSPPNEITWQLMNNSASNKHKFSPWIVAHRAFHIIQHMGVGKYTDEINDIMMPSHNAFSEILNAYGIAVPDNTTVFGISPDLNTNASYPTTDAMAVFSQLGSMKSVRINAITKTGDIFPELYAQFIVTGRITANKMPQTFEYCSKSWSPNPINSDKYNLLMRRRNTTQYSGSSNINAIVGRFIKTTEQCFDKLNKFMIGRELVF